MPNFCVSQVLGKVIIALYNVELGEYVFVVGFLDAVVVCFDGKHAEVLCSHPKRHYPV